MKCTRCGAKIPAKSTFCPSCGTPQPPQKKSRKALWISLIALVLVIAICGSTVFIVTRVSAGEIQEAKNQYQPPAKALNLDLTQKDPSNEAIKFTYDDRARIVSCTYQVNDKKYDQRYTYDDVERCLEIITAYKDKDIFTKNIPYDVITEPDVFEDVEGYVVRLDDGSLNGGESPSPTKAPSATQPPATEAPAITEADTYSGLEEFLDRFISCYSDETPVDQSEYGTRSYYQNHCEYDYRQTASNDQNILKMVCGTKSAPCVELNNFKENSFQFQNKNVSMDTCPWNDELVRNMDYAATADEETVDFVCREVFNITDAEIASLYQRAYDEKTLWKSGGCYCMQAKAKGGPGYKVRLTDVQTDGRYYYVTYDMCDHDLKNFDQPGEYHATFYAVMEQKELNGEKLWSMYVHTRNVPDTIENFSPLF